MKIIFSLLFTMLAADAFAQYDRRPPRGPDLRRISDEALLEELSYRNYFCQYRGRETERIISIVCDPYTNMKVSLLDMSGTTVATYENFMASNRLCEEAKAKILRATDGRIYEDRTVAYCDSQTNLIKIKFSKNSIKQSEKTFQSSNKRCQEAADQFNNLFGNL